MLKEIKGERMKTSKKLIKLFLLSFFLIFTYSCSRISYKEIKRTPSSSNREKVTFFTTDSIMEDYNNLPLSLKYMFAPGSVFDQRIGITGAVGPLSEFGPLGNNPFNPTYWMRQIGPWVQLRQWLTEHGGPLSQYGPNYLHSEYIEDLREVFLNYAKSTDINTYNVLKHLMPGGLLHVLGTAGNLSPLSGLSLNGANGATGLQQDFIGNFIDEDGEIIHHLDVDTVDGKWSMPLNELYHPLDTAQNFHSNDAFFGLDGSVNNSNKSYKISFKSNYDQWVSILLVESYTLDDFELIIREKGYGKILTKSSNTINSNFIVAKVPAGTEYEVEVKLKSSLHFLPKKKFRIYISGDAGKMKDIGHQDHHKEVLLESRVNLSKSGSCVTELAEILK